MSSWPRESSQRLAPRSCHPRGPLESSPQNRRPRSCRPHGIGVVPESSPPSCRPGCPPELWPYSRRPGVVPGSRPPQDNNNSGRQLRVAAWGNSDLAKVVQGNNNSKRQQPGATAQDNNLGQRLGATATRRQQLSNSSSERQQLEATALGDSLG